MNSLWRNLVIIGVILVMIVVGWDLFLVVSGIKSTFRYNLPTISGVLYGPVEDHLRASPEFAQFEEDQLGL